jgi:hypothetical protein
MGMGNFYTNYVLRAPTSEAVAKTLRERSAIVVSAKGYVAVFDEESDNQDIEVISELATQLSGNLKCAVLAVLNHDDDILCYWLYDGGRLVDEYDSAPGYFDANVESDEPSGGDASRLCAAFEKSNVEQVERMLRGDFFVFAFERHQGLLEALGLPEFLAGTSYSSLQHYLPEGLSEGQLIRTR